MKEFPEENGQFKMRMDDEVEPSPITADVDDLRIEKLSHRMTLITILIPVLIVVVLVMTYLDIKRRVVKTEDTGQLTAQTLSEDLESRFSKLSLGQALIEENLQRFIDQTNESVAKVQVNLKNMGDSLKKSSKSMASRKEVTAATSKMDKMDKGIGEMSQALDALRAQLSELDAAIQPRLAGIEQALSQDRSQVQQMDERLTGVEENKLDKPAMELALKLEILKLKQSLKAQMEEIDSKLSALKSKVDKQAARAASRPAPPAPPAAVTAPPAKPPAAASPGTLKEQTIQQ